MFTSPPYGFIVTVACSLAKIECELQRQAGFICLDDALSYVQGKRMQSMIKCGNFVTVCELNPSTQKYSKVECYYLSKVA